MTRSLVPPIELGAPVCASLTADEIAEVADFFSYGTNDLTQMTFGFSRDDIGSFLPAYLGKGRAVAKDQ